MSEIPWQVENDIVRYIVDKLRALFADERLDDKIKVNGGGALTGGPWVEVSVYDDVLRDGLVLIYAQFSDTNIRVTTTDKSLIGPSDMIMAEIPLSSPYAFDRVIDAIKEIVSKIYLAKRRVLRRRAKKLQKEIKRTHRMIKRMEPEK